MNIFSFLLYFWKEKNYLIYCINKTTNYIVSWLFTKKNTMQGTFVNLCYTMENHAIATMLTYFGSTDHGLGTEVDRGQGGGTSGKNKPESPLIYIYIYIYIYITLAKELTAATQWKLFVWIEHSGIRYAKMWINKSYEIIPYNSRADVCYRRVEWRDTTSNVKLGGFRSQLQASYVSNHTEELWYNETVCLWMTTYIQEKL